MPSVARHLPFRPHPKAFRVSPRPPSLFVAPSAPLLSPRALSFCCPEPLFLSPRTPLFHVVPNVPFHVAPSDSEGSPLSLSPRTLLFFVAPSVARGLPFPCRPCFPLLTFLQIVYNDFIIWTIFFTLLLFDN